MNAGIELATRRWRKALVAAMLLALGVILLGPLCEVAMDGAAHHAPVEVCCASAGDQTLAKQADPLARFAADPGDAIAVLIAATVVFAAGLAPTRAHRARHAAPPQAPFHSRSARIRR